MGVVMGVVRCWLWVWLGVVYWCGYVLVKSVVIGVGYGVVSCWLKV